MDTVRPVSLYPVIPPSDISGAKPLVRLVLNQIGRRLTEKLEGDPAKLRKHQLLMMLNEFPALGRLDFFETALAFMAGYGIRAYLIAQSLNQISTAYGENNAILDDCHVRIAFSSNDEHIAKRVSDALGTATEIRAQRNYAGHRLAPARPLLTPGEVMQLPPVDELVLVSGLGPSPLATGGLFQQNPAICNRFNGKGGLHARSGVSPVPVSLPYWPIAVAGDYRSANRQRP